MLLLLNRIFSEIPEFVLLLQLWTTYMDASLVLEGFFSRSRFLPII